MEGKPQCYSNPDCRTTEQCHLGNCVHACLLLECGANAECTARQHNAFCTCIGGYSGDPTRACYPSKFRVRMFMMVFLFASLPPPASTVLPPTEPPLDPGCDTNSDCPEHKKCINRICRDPCVVEDPCATNAFCKVVAHEAVCTCPQGFFGDPRVECRPRKFLCGGNDHHQ